MIAVSSWSCDVDGLVSIVTAESNEVGYSPQSDSECAYSKTQSSWNVVPSIGLLL